MGILTRKGLGAGAVVVLFISILHSQTFRSDVFGWSELIAWYLVSLLVGCITGYIAGLLISLIPARLNSSVAGVGGALFGIFAYYIQVFLYIIYVFRTTSSDY
jgi:membrane associated rhomboid family serine protease